MKAYVVIEEHPRNVHNVRGVYRSEKTAKSEVELHSGTTEWTTNRHGQPTVATDTSNYRIEEHLLDGV